MTKQERDKIVSWIAEELYDGLSDHSLDFELHTITDRGLADHVAIEIDNAKFVRLEVFGANIVVGRRAHHEITELSMMSLADPNCLERLKDMIIQYAQE
jgi:hypothetical protein